METQTFTTTRKKHGHTFSTAWRVAVEASKLAESCKGDRWYKAMAPFITKVEQWSIQSDMLLQGSAVPTEAEWAEKAKHQWPDKIMVVHTKFGTACITMFQGGSAISGMTVNGPRKATSKTLGTWRKYGSKRGHGMGYLRAMAGLGRCTSPEAGRDVCEFEAMCRLTQGGYEAADHKATSAIYAVVEGKAA